MSAYDDYNGPTCWADCSVEELAEATQTGVLCSECGTEFTKAHGHPVACAFCKRRGSELPKATHAELSREAHKERARARRKAK